MTKQQFEGRETRAVSLEVRAIGEDGTIEGYGSIFNFVDSYSDVVEQGAFTKSLADHKSKGTMPAMLWQHEEDEPIGVWTEMSEDKSGLKVKGRLVLETQKGREAYALLKAGAINGLSIGFMATKRAYDETGNIRTVSEIDLWEVSLVTFPANTKARITDVKSVSVDEINTPSQAEKVLREAGFSKSDATAFASRLMRFGYQRREAEEVETRTTQAAERLLKLLKTH